MSFADFFKREKRVSEKQAIALYDNSAFAGVLRCYIPDLETHRRFLEAYPDHLAVDQVSLAQFLSSVCVFDNLTLDVGSRLSVPGQHFLGEDGQVHQREDDEREPIVWAEELIAFLPGYLRGLFVETTSDPAIDTARSCRIAYDLVESAATRPLVLSQVEALPDVYNYTEDYVYRSTFDQLNESTGRVLDEKLLSYAMFLHRGIFLQDRAAKQGSTYLPYHYRGKTLAALSPLISARVPSRYFDPRLPLADNTARPQEDELAVAVNRFYYQLLSKVCWTTYDVNIPFVGAAILAKAEGNVEDAFEIAMELRAKGSLRNEMRPMMAAAELGRRGEYERRLAAFQRRLEVAATRLGANTDNPISMPFMELILKAAVAWIPGSYTDVVEQAMEVLPSNVRHWADYFASRLLVQKPSQMLFVDHAKALQVARHPIVREAVA